MNSKFKFQKSKFKNQRGVTLFIAVTIMAILLFISFVVINIAVKSTQFAGTARESQLAFSAADAGIECALYWDTQEPNPFVVKMSTFADYYINEFSGIENLANPLHEIKNKSVVVPGGTFPDDTLFSSDPVTTAFDNELIFGWLQEGSIGCVEEGPGFNWLTDLRCNLQEWKVAPLAGVSHVASGYYENASGNGEYMATIATFKPASGQIPSFTGNGSYEYINGDPLPPVELTFPNSSTNGNLILVSVGYNSGVFQLESVTDNKGNQYTKLFGPDNWANYEWAGEMWYAWNIKNSGTPPGGVFSSAGEPITITANSPAFVPVNLECNGETVLATPNPWSSNDVNTNPPQPHCLGGECAEDNDNTSIFQLNFENGTCSIITVEKESGGETIIQSKGYNTCNTSNPRRVERGVEVRY
ncbi:MAG TPA: pilus assembly PilX N-terminal domain-containing protein [Candidatus Paceibacterota bacterium]